ncbi:MAG: ATP-dependent DNA helicase RecG [Patescibacteria group bacterium]|jgi:ATP-dependent DNA helicase RecG
MAKNFFYHTPLSELHAITSGLQKDFNKLEIKTVGDLLWYFPFRYDDLSEVKKISELTDDELTTIKVSILKIRSFRSWKRKIMITEIVVTDGEEQLTATWFNQKFVSQILKIGDEVFLNGKLQMKGTKYLMSNPSYEKVKDRPLHSARLVPNYHLSGKITQKQLRFVIDKALKIAPSVEDPFPVEILNKEKYPWLFEALEQIHFPGDLVHLEKAIQRLKFQELFYLQLKYQLAKKDYQNNPTYQIPTAKIFLNKIIKNLPFRLTADQLESLDEVLSDIAKTQPMNRLLEGDVGSGKTIVAMLSAFSVIKNGQQVAFMAPTEILARQHYLNALKLWPTLLAKNTALLSSSQQLVGLEEKSTKQNISKLLANGKIKLIFGTHSLIQDNISFKDLALVIIDEQHRFGVKQRQALKTKNNNNFVPHLLSMTATPIPRTLSLTLYGDLDISLIKSKPLGRQIVKTFLVPEKKRLDAYNFIREKIKAGQQAFIICPLIDESDPSRQPASPAKLGEGKAEADKLGAKSVLKEYEKIKNEIFPDLNIAMLHGQMSAEEKNAVMTDFKAKKSSILVATSVIEVGVDIPGATLMLIESAERFGLSQLHQFRGRVGRNDLESFCLLFTSDPTKQTTKRLQILTSENDGFKLAELDLELRGSGSIFGTKQTGLMPLKIATLTDTVLLKKAQEWARKIITNKKYRSQTQVVKLLEDLKTEMHLE